MRLVITGAGGMLGQDVERQAERAGHEAIALDRAALDVTDAAAVEGAFADLRPDVVMGCAAWTDVDGAEADEDGARRLNVDGARNVALAAEEVGAAVVHVSTDYVFAGDGDRPYVESDPTGPQSAYGRTKLAGEQAVLAACTRAHVVRTAWLFGPGGTNFVDTMLSLAERGEVRVVDDQIGSPTYTAHLAEGLVQLAGRGEYGIRHMVAAGHCSWFEFARAIFEEAGVDCTVKAVSSDEFPRPARRPAWSVLGSERPDAIVLPEWRDGLRAYLGTR